MHRLNGSRWIWDSPAQVLILSGLGGGVVGYWRAVWADIMSVAFHHAGTASHPVGNVMGYAVGHVFTLPVQAATLMLKLGVPAGTVSTAIYTVQGVLWAQAIGLVVYALGRSAPLALVAAILFCIKVPYAATVHYTDYLITVFDVGTHGILALGLALLVIGLVGVGWWRAAGAIVGLTFAVHPLMAAWSLAGSTATLLIVHQRLPWRRFAAGVGIGAVITGLSWIAWLLWRVSPGEVLPPADPQYLHAYFDFWDYHRNADLSLMHRLATAQAVMVVAVVAICWWRSHRHIRSGSEGALMIFIAGSSAVAIVLYLAFHAFREILPFPILVLMPNRFLNIPVALSFAVLGGMLARQSPHPLALAGLAVLISVPLFRPEGEAPTYEAITAISLGVALILMFIDQKPESGAASVEVEADKSTSGYGLVLPIVAWLTVLGAAGFALVKKGGPFLANDATAERQFNALLAQIPGPMAVADNWTVERLRRVMATKALLLDLSAIDYIAYFPEIAPRMAKILGDVYGVDYFNPPPITYRRGQLHLNDYELAYRGSTPTRELWEALTEEEWQRLGRQYLFGGVIAPAHWAVRLPMIITVQLGPEGALRLYRIP